jgi:hypothetical protein
MKQEITYDYADVRRLIDIDLKSKGLTAIIEITKSQDFKVTLEVTPLAELYTDATNLSKPDAKELFAMYGWREAEPIPTPKKRKK